MKTTDKIKSIIERTKEWNGGAGLIVPPSFGKKLKALGIKTGFTIDKPMTSPLLNSEK